MKKWLFSFLVVLVMLTGCANDGEGASSEVTDPIDVDIIISLDNDAERLVDETLTVNDGANLLEVLTDEYDIEKTADGFIQSIEGHAQTSSAFWLFDVNGAPSEVGAGDVELSDGDDIHFDLHEYEG
ncbi:hypothetical protein HMI01_14640 [Halolactibacillus miurensis]|uniref:Transcobalamin-like C-terminal domain-containing protein n=1 Tax=Halolactibacillus miurensis TaxID=306541 RepID=A0A1I6PVF2_9BACI|nr:MULTISPECIES: DUF4430 domain-containing protein [Halolactibacillus]GEM04476.1 hypothetical protein HMI01_14640 [Halolactibacillus miurensis]SFS44221.1 protein of unknown function [Halolactibacillus miurensis]